MAIQFKCRSCPNGGSIYLPDRGEHVCIKHAPIDERQVPAYSGWEPDTVLEYAVELARLDIRKSIEDKP